MDNGVESKETKADAATAEVARVSVKVPSFWKPDPKIWFLQLEEQFRNAKLTVDQTKYNYVISSIEPYPIFCLVLRLMANTRRLKRD
ncbi:hypothetical protein NPIL_64441 [Nephila pilipes]|uniref:DUF7041 domain-containing protein n=1 Tax=Nephila pilipes TaxID=299642 RepID=A0A8X6TDV8_NEPPI|nr:hypothetical protein NPIL_64441 [Nephila pilipes]